MRSRDEVLQQFGWEAAQSWSQENAAAHAMADRIRELEARLNAGEARTVRRDSHHASAIAGAMSARIEVLDEFISHACDGECIVHDCIVERNMADEIVRLRKALSAAPVLPVVTEAMIEAAAKALYLRGDLSIWTTWEDEIWRYKETYYEDAKAILTAALPPERGEEAS